MKLATLMTSLALVSIAPRAADAFCGFYVNQGDQPLYNDATQVVLMRMGTRTVLSMQNNYKGPPEAFAMVIPVPVVLQEADVKTLPKEVFRRVDLMSSPRLVEYWEQDPCAPPVDYDERPVDMASAAPETKPTGTAGGLGVTVEAKFTVGEYDVVILSAKDSTGLETWLKQEKYQIPAGAEPLLRPYVVSGMKFFVAKVDPAKVKFGPDQRAALSPLRFHYDSEEFALPIRLGLASSSGMQDLIVNILAPRQRYNVANYDNVTIPTNIDVSPQMKDKFPAFYAALFDRTLEKHPKAVVTEYAWDASSCDPCPGPNLGGDDFATLGADVLTGTREQPVPYRNMDFVLTRLHARYGKDITDDLRFQAAPGIMGGREVPGANGKLEEGARAGGMNNFQGRYAIRYPWTKPITCDKPQRGIWGGPPADVAPTGAGNPQGATDLGLAPRGQVQLVSAVMQDVPEIDLKAGASKADATGSGAQGSAMATPSSSGTPKKSGCGCAAADRNGVLGGALLVGASLFVRRRRRRSPGA